MATNETRRSPARGRPRDEDRAARRDALLESAMRQFLTHGYSATTIEEVAAGARVAKRTIYTTIGDKEELFVAVVRRLGDRAVTATTGDADDPVARLHAFGVRLVRLMLSDEAVGLHRLVIGEAARFPELACRHYMNGSQRYIGVLCDLLAALPPGALVLADHGPGNDLPAQAEALFTQLLGERHRRRLFGLDPAPADDDIDKHVARTLDRFVTGAASALPARSQDGGATRSVAPATSPGARSRGAR